MTDKRIANKNIFMVTANKKNINLIKLGLIDYDSTILLQKKEKELVASGKSNGTIFLLEHDPPVISFGRNASKKNLLIEKHKLEDMGYQIRESSRGGDVTVHEPGQLVVYFVLPVKSKNTKHFINKIINLLQKFLHDEYSIISDYNSNRPGLWVENKKICSVGFDLTGCISMHGIALNVANSLKGFSMIIPCGIDGIEMTNLSIVIGQKVKLKNVIEKLSIKLLEFNYSI